MTSLCVPQTAYCAIRTKLAFVCRQEASVSDPKAWWSFSNVRRWVKLCALRKKKLPIASVNRNRRVNGNDDVILIQKPVKEMPKPSTRRGQKIQSFEWEKLRLDVNGLHRTLSLKRHKTKRRKALRCSISLCDVKPVKLDKFFDPFFCQNEMLWHPFVRKLGYLIVLLCS